MADEYEVFIEASVRGYHAYFKDATVVIGEVLMCERELDIRQCVRQICSGCQQ